MSKIANLVIVESPAKAQTIEKILGSDYHVLSSYGHIRDLKKRGLGIDIEHNFEPDYEISDDKEKVVAQLKSAVKKADVVWLASDEDREGEAIAWHLYEVLNLKEKNTKRIVFHEITPAAIHHAIENPRDIDIHLVDAQQARRALDRIVGFELSPVLWKRIKPSLSAGRVQSAVLRLVCEREEEIHAFESSSYYKVSATFHKEGTKQPIQAELSTHYSQAQEAQQFILNNAKDGKFFIDSVEGKELKRMPAPPFTTSSLQQEASRRLGFPVRRTMSIAQSLYEAGYITYMRTDSTQLSNLAINTAAQVIKSNWGEKYHKARNYQTKSKGAQEAHEAIRPTYMDREEIPGDAAAQKLYKLIRQRTLASQMSEALFKKTTISIANASTGDAFTASGEEMLFDGFMKVYGADDKETGENQQLPSLQKGDKMELDFFKASQHFTYPPSRYTDASLVRKMEEMGIGRPSTYAPTINTLFTRDYIVQGTQTGKERSYTDYILRATKNPNLNFEEKVRTEKTGSEKGKLMPTDIGVVVNKYLVETFPTIVDYHFTANIEEEFDKISLGESKWTKSLKDFYKLFHPLVEDAMKDTQGNTRGERELGVDPKSGRSVIARISRFGAVVQLGKPDDGSGQKPQFAAIKQNQSISTITLEEALDLLQLPRVLGTFEDTDVKVNSGRFGPYVQLGSLFVTIPADKDLFTITLEEAIELIQAKREKEEKSVLKTFPEDADIIIKDGRFGPFIKQGKNNYKLPKNLHDSVDSITFEQVMEIINEEGKGKAKTTRKSTAKKSTAKRTSTKSKKAE